MSTPTETVDIGEALIAKGVVLGVAMKAEGVAPLVVEIPAEVLKFPQSPRPRPIPTQ